MSVLAVTMWGLGEVERARESIDQAGQRAERSRPRPVNDRSSPSEILSRSPQRGRERSLGGGRGARGSGPGTWDAVPAHPRGNDAGWARGRLHDAEQGAADLRRALAERVDQGARVHGRLHTVLLAELQAQTLGVERALA